MSEKPLIWRVVLAVVVVGVLVAAGFGIYQLGYRNGTVAASAGEGFFPGVMGHFEFFYDDDGDFLMPHEGGRVFFPGDDDGFPKPRQGKGGFFQDNDRNFNDKDLFKKKISYQSFPTKSITFYSPFSLIVKLVVLGVFLWLIYKFITMFTQGNGWQLSFTRNEDVDEKGKKKK